MVPGANPIATIAVPPGTYYVGVVPFATVPIAANTVCPFDYEIDIRFETTAGDVRVLDVSRDSGRSILQDHILPNFPRAN